MSHGPWTVKTRSGAIWGKIHRVIIDSSSRQILCIDVMLDNAQLIRVPWTSLEVGDDEIVLGTSEGDIHTAMRPLDGGVPDTVTLEESAPPCHV
jgi:hypothetical protein